MKLLLTVWLFINVLSCGFYSYQGHDFSAGFPSVEEMSISFPFLSFFFCKLKAVCFPWVTLPIPLLLLSWAAGGVCTRSCARAGGIVVVLFPEGSKAPFLPWEYKFLVLSCYIYGAAVRAVGCARVCVLFGLLYFGWPQDNEEGAGGWRRQGVLGLLGCCCCRAGCWRGCLALHSSQSLCCALKVSM